MRLAMRKMDRRSFLKSSLKTSGVAMSLPLLETLAWADAPETPARMVNICATLGLYAAAGFGYGLALCRLGRAGCLLLLDS